jgi:hypothetical protein
MTGTAFLAELRTKVAPRKVTLGQGTTGGITISISDGKSVTVSRGVIKAAANWAALPANVKALV